MMKKSYKLAALFLIVSFASYGILHSFYSSLHKHIFAYEDQQVINYEFEGNAEHPDMATNDEGDGVIVWQQKTTSWNVYAQLIKNGERVGDVFLVNQITNGNQKFPKVAISKDGSFIVVWQSYTTGKKGSGIYGQKFRASGRRRGSEFVIHTYRRKNKILPDIAMNAEGGFVVTWVSEWQDKTPKSIYAKFFDADGNGGKETKVNRYMYGSQTSPVIAVNSQNQVMIVWQSNQGQGWDIYGQVFNWGGEKGNSWQDILINTEEQYNQAEPSITANPSGNFVVVWSNNAFNTVFKVLIENIMGQALDGMGGKIGQVFNINEPTFGHNSHPVIASNSNSNSVVVWQSFENGYWENLAQHLDANNNLIGYSIAINEYDQEDDSDDVNENWNFSPAVIFDSMGDYTIAWTNYNREKKQKNIFFQEFNKSAVLSKQLSEEEEA